jgi:hypothetical protein
MLINIFLDFDDTIFPSHFMATYYHCDAGIFVPPTLVLEQLQQLDRLITNFITKYMSYCRFRIVTRASKKWLTQSLALFPILQRYIDWHYVTIIHCEFQISKQDELYEILSREKSVDAYLCCGDSSVDINAVPNILIQLGLDAKIRSLLFVKKPSVTVLLIQWEKVHECFLELMKDETKWIARHFTITDDCDHLSDPNLYHVVSLDSTFTQAVNVVQNSPTITLQSPKSTINSVSESFSGSYILKKFSLAPSLIPLKASPKLGPSLQPILEDEISEI